MSHKFLMNQRVQISPDNTLAQASTDGIYTIVRLMPQGRDGEYGYRLKSQSGERVATEGVLIAIANQDAVVARV